MSFLLIKESDAILTWELFVFICDKTRIRRIPNKIKEKSLVPDFIITISNFFE